MALDYDRLVLDSQQAAQIDNEFLGITVEMLNQCSGYRDMAWRMVETSLGDELEEIYVRTMDRANQAIHKSEKVSKTVLQSLARVSFIDTLHLPSSEVVQKRRTKDRWLDVKEPFIDPSEDPARRGVNPWHFHRRLFVNLSNSDR